MPGKWANNQGCFACSDVCTQMISWGILYMAFTGNLWVKLVAPECSRLDFQQWDSSELQPFEIINSFMLFQLNLYEHEKGLSIVPLQNANNAKVLDMQQVSWSWNTLSESLLLDGLHVMVFGKPSTNLLSEIITIQRDYRGQHTCWVKNELWEVCPPVNSVCLMSYGKMEPELTLKRTPRRRHRSNLLAWRLGLGLKEIFVLPVERKGTDNASEWQLFWNWMKGLIK